MFFGSFKGIYVTELTDDGLSVKRDVDGKPVFEENKILLVNANLRGYKYL